MKSLKVINSQEEKEDFEKDKIYKACRRSGASKEIAEEVAEEIAKNAYQNIETSEIAKLVTKLLTKKSKKPAIKFSLKKAMRKLGPAGFNFEKFVAAIFLENNFKVKINQKVSGACISSYEIDFTARKKEEKKIGECKYHSSSGKRADLQVALYNYARFLDIKRKNKSKKLQPILITNTKFTSKAIKYSECNDVELLGWRYPKTGGLEKLIEKDNLYPITILPSFKKIFKDVFAKKRMMLASDLLGSSSQKISRKTNIDLKHINQLVKEAKILLK